MDVCYILPVRFYRFSILRNIRTVVNLRYSTMLYANVAVPGSMHFCC